MGDVKFSVHAVECYMERVRPGLCFGDAAGELEALVHQGIASVSGKPPWQHEKPQPEWLVIGDDIAFPLCRTRGYLLATTCKVRGGEQRTQRRVEARREAKRKARELRRWRANRKTERREEAA